MSRKTWLIVMLILIIVCFTACGDEKPDSSPTVQTETEEIEETTTVELPTVPTTSAPVMVSIFTTTSELNVRSGGGTSYDVIYSAKAGEELELTGNSETSNGGSTWYEIIVPSTGDTGWVSGKYGTISEQAKIADPDEDLQSKNDILNTEDEFNEVFFVDLQNNAQNYEGKTITTTAPITYVYSSGRLNTEKIGEKDLEIETGIKDLEDHKYATVCGLVSVDSHTVTIANAELLYYGDEAPTYYAYALYEYSKELKEEKIEIREDTINSAIDVSYDDLRRYPDTYKDKILRLKIKVIDVEPDGLFTKGTIEATMDGQTIAVRDERELREPRFVEGDKVIIYAKGAGIVTLKKYVKGSGILGSDLGAKVVDEKEIPSVEMIYTDLDNLDSFGNLELINNDDAYNRGKEAAEKINKMLE